MSVSLSGFCTVQVLTVGTGNTSALRNSEVYAGVRFVEYSIDSASTTSVSKPVKVMGTPLYMYE